MNIIRKKHKIINRAVRITGHQYAQDFRTLVVNGDMIVERSSEYNKYEKDRLFTDIKSTSTYQDCLVVLLNEDSTVEIIVYDGDDRLGSQENVRVIYTLSGKWWLHKVLFHTVNNMFTEHTSRILTKEKEAEDEQRRQAIEDRLLAE